MEQPNAQNSSNKKKKVKQTRSFWGEVYDWIDCAIITITCVLLVFTFLFNQVKIDGSSMENTLQHGERVIVSNLFYTPEYGDIVVISNEIYGEVPIIKRVIAVGGQWVDIHDGSVYVGNSLDSMVPVGNEFIGDRYTDAIVGNGFYGQQNYPLRVPENYVFVLGDNRDVSLDSRTDSEKGVGLVDCRHILGKALYRIYPFEKFGSIYYKG